MSERSQTTANTILNVRGLRKTYHGNVAIKNIDSELRAGEIHGLCGENCAGKSRLVKVLGGLVAPTEGDIEVNGILLRPGKKTDPRLISIVHQDHSIIPDLSVSDNVLIGDPMSGEFLRRARHAETIRRELEESGLAHVDLNEPARKLSLAELAKITRGVVRGGQDQGPLRTGGQHAGRCDRRGPARKHRPVQAGAGRF